ncbi:MAG TPA: hypothetical protein VGS22_25320 [Thermoanaerobaculia bacterium]|jgi:hypothetical protein|nr:hypothetical protein [Thermoanaerobaculia bacterium]
MPHRSPLRAAAPPFLLLLLLFALSPPPANAAPLGAGPPLLDRLWRFVTSIWSEAGCGIDTNGQCKEAPAARPEGCALDPNGACAPAPILRQERCGIDPDGRCGR